MKKKLSFLMAVIMIVAVMIPAIPVSAATDTYSQGDATKDGTATLTITTANDFVNFYNDAMSAAVKGKTIQVAADIDLAKATVDGFDPNVGFKPTNRTAVLNESTFKGTKTDGTNAVITNFKVDTTGTTWAYHGAALFGATVGKVYINNITLDNFTIKGHSNVVRGNVNAGANGNAGFVGTVADNSNDTNAARLEINDCALKNGTITATASEGNTAALGSVLGCRKFDRGQVVRINRTVVDSSVKLISQGEGEILMGDAIGFLTVTKTSALECYVNFTGSRINPTIECNAATTVHPGNIGGYFYTDNITHTIIFQDDNTGFRTASNAGEVTKLNSVTTNVKTELGESAPLIDVMNVCADRVLARTYNSADSVIKITSVGDFMAYYRDISKSDMLKNKTVKLMNDITLGAENAINLKDSERTAVLNASVFDGNGKTINGFKVNNIGSHMDGGAALFGAVLGDSTIKNLTLKNFTVIGKSCGKSDASVDRNNGYGALVGTVMDNSNDATNKLTVDNCTLDNGTITANVANDMNAPIGAVVGRWRLQNSDTANIYNTVVKDNVKLVAAKVADADIGDVQTGKLVGAFILQNDVEITDRVYNIDVTGTVCNVEDANVTVGGVADASVHAFGTIYLRICTSAKVNVVNTCIGVSQTLDVSTESDNTAIVNTAAAGIVATAAPSVKLLGYQERTAKDGIRFVGAVDNYADFDTLGFEMTVKMGDKTAEKIYAVTKVYTAMSNVEMPEGYGYLFSVAIIGLEAGETIEITVNTYAKTASAGAEYRSTVFNYTYVAG